MENNQRNGSFIKTKTVIVMGITGTYISQEFSRSDEIK